MSARLRTRKRRRRTERTSLQILEESFHLVRRTDPKNLLVLYAGMVPFVLGLLYFTADMTRPGRDTTGPGGIALVMAALYFAMRACQAAFCARLWSELQPGRPRASAGAGFRSLAALFLIQSIQVPLLAVAAFFVIPLPWALATLQNATALSLASPGARPGLRELAGRSLRYSHEDWPQNHGVLLVFAFVALFTWLNLLASAVILFQFSGSLLGIESVFTMNPGAALGNSVFLLATMLAAYLALSPMLKSVYVLRCFYASSRESGADLLARLDLCETEERTRPERQPAAATPEGGAEGRRRGVRKLASGPALLLAALITAAPTAEATADEGAGPPVAATVSIRAGAVDPEELQAEINRTLLQPKYRWKLPRDRWESEEETKGRSAIATALRNAARQAQESLEAWLDSAWKAIERIFLRRQSRERGGGAGEGSGFEEFRSILSIGLVVLLAALIAWAAWFVYRRHLASAEKLDDGTLGGAVDLRSESILASQLPEDEWMRLAREQVKQGDRRLAMRAVFLASLANLGEGRIVGVARFKSNRDYRAELARRASRFEALLAAFDENVVLFERSWYGRHPATEEGYARFLENYETIVKESRLASERVRRLPLAG